MPETLELNKDQLLDFIKGQCREFMMEDVGDQIEEKISKQWGELEKKSKKEAHDAEMEAFRKGLFGSKERSLDVSGLRSKRFNGIAKSDANFDGSMVAGITLCFAKAVADRTSVADAAKAIGRLDVAKAMEASTFSGGGSLIPTEYAADFIGALYSKSVVRMLGANVIQLPNGNLSLGKQNATAQHFWVNESGSITTSQPSTALINLSAKKSGVLVPVSNDLIQYAPQGAEEMIRQDMIAVTNVGEDSAMIRGAGSANKPKGIYYWVADGQRFDPTAATAAAPTLQEATSDLLKMRYKVESNNHHDMIRPGWMANHRIKYALMQLRTSDGYPVYLMELSNGTLMGVPFAATNNIPKNLSNGGNDDNTEVYFGDFAQCIIGESLDMSIQEDSGASYIDAEGNTVHSFQQDQKVYRLIHKIDFALRHNTAFSIMKNCRWGASLDS